MLGRGGGKGGFATCLAAAATLGTTACADRTSPQSGPALIAAAPNLQALQADFTLRAMPDKDALQWVQATPKTRDGQLQSISIGFRNAGKTSELAVLEIVDSFGQRSVMRFAGFEANPAFNAAHFDFKPPTGADVIRP